MLAGDLGIAIHCILAMADEPPRLANPTPIGQMPQDGQSLLLGQMRAEQGGTFALGKRTCARLAEDHADPLPLAAPAMYNASTRKVEPL